MRPLRGGCSLQLCKAPRRRVVYRWNELREKSFVVRKHYIFCVFVAFIIRLAVVAAVDIPAFFFFAIYEGLIKSNKHRVREARGEIVSL